MTALGVFYLGGKVILHAILLAVLLAAFIVAAIILCSFFIGIVENDREDR